MEIHFSGIACLPCSNDLTSLLEEMALHIGSKQLRQQTPTPNSLKTAHRSISASTRQLPKSLQILADLASIECLIGYTEITLKNFRQFCFYYLLSARVTRITDF